MKWNIPYNITSKTNVPCNVYRASFLPKDSNLLFGSNRLALLQIWQPCSGIKTQKISWLSVRNYCTMHAWQCSCFWCLSNITSILQQKMPQRHKTNFTSQCAYTWDFISFIFRSTAALSPTTVTWPEVLLNLTSTSWLPPLWNSCGLRLRTAVTWAGLKCWSSAANPQKNCWKYAKQCFLTFGNPCNEKQSTWSALYGNNMRKNPHSPVTMSTHERLLGKERFKIEQCFKKHIHQSIGLCLSIPAGNKNVSCHFNNCSIRRNILLTYLVEKLSNLKAQ